MAVQSMSFRRFFIAGLLTAGCMGFYGCSPETLGDGIKTDYKIQNVDDDEETTLYLNKIFEERLKNKTSLFEPEAEAGAQKHQEDSIEMAIRADLQKALHSRGYYAPDIRFSEGAEPFSGAYEINYGPRFTISDMRITPDAFSGITVPVDHIDIGEPLDAARVLALQADVYRKIQKDGCYFTLDVHNEVILDRLSHTADVSLVVDAGREGHFGPIHFTGNGRVRESYLRRLVPWKEGDCFHREALERYKTALLQSGLFSRADMVLPDAPGEDGSVPVAVELKERAQRTISAGMHYYTDEGIAAVLGWEHRNLLGAAEKLKTTLNLSLLKQSLEFDFSKPFFLRDDQSLSLNAALRRQDTDAFEELGLDFGGSVNRRLGRHLTGSSGVNISLLRIDDPLQNEADIYGLLSAPQSLSYDSRDDPLEPRKGAQAAVSVEPFVDLLGNSDPFIKTQMSGSTYFPVGTSADIVLAARATLGSIWGTDMDGVPATERFYAGGGGSVRGYGYQEVGPKKNGDPSGGLSLVTGSFEIRSKFTEKIGAVAFVDVGSVGEDSTPSFGDVAVGAGLGARYYTDFGPVRFDVAVPLTQKDDLDQKIQFYISIGQAF